MPLTPDLAATSLIRHVKHSKEVVKAHNHRLAENIDGYVGRYFSRDQAGRQDDPTNARFEFIGLFLPEVAGGVPRWSIECAVTGPGEQIADGMMLSLTEHARDNRYDNLFERIGVDFCMSRGIVETFPERRTDARNLLGGGPLYAPISRRVDQERAFWDVTDTDVEFGETAFRGASKTAVRKTLTAADGWDQDAITRLAEFRDESRIQSKRDALWSDRDVVSYDCIYVPGADAEMVRELGYDTTKYEQALAERPYLYNGWMFYLAESGEYLRSPEPFFGPAMGPYVIFDGYPVPGSTFRGSTLTFTGGQQEALNQSERALLVAEEEYKKILLYAAENDQIAAKITDTPSGEAVAVPELHNNGAPLFQEIEFGGASQTMHATVQRRRLSLDRNLGLSDEQKGVSNSGATATASSIAASSGQSRLGWQAQKFYGAASQVGYINAWYMFHDEQYARSLPQSGGKGRFVEYSQDGELQPVLDPVFRGGVTPEDNFTFDDFAFKFDYMSVRHKTDDMRRAEGSEIAMMIANIAPLMPQTPYVRWDEYWEYVGESFNQPWLKTLFDYKKLSELTGMELEQQSEVVPFRQAGARAQFNLAAPKQRSSDTQQPPQPQPAEGAPIAQQGQQQAG